MQAAAAALDAYEVTAEAEWLRWAEALMERVWREYRDEGRGGLFDTVPSGRGEGLLPARLKPIQDTPTPSPNGVAGVVCARLHALTEDVRWAERRRGAGGGLRRAAPPRWGFTARPTCWRSTGSSTRRPTWW